MRDRLPLWKLVSRGGEGTTHQGYISADLSADSSALCIIFQVWRSGEIETPKGVHSVRSESAQGFTGVIMGTVIDLEELYFKLIPQKYRNNPPEC